MKDEIKEILDYLSKFINDKEEITKYGCEISVKQAKQLLDYITNLQEENERLSRTTVMYDELLDSKNNIIDKAIEYIELDILDNKIENVNWDFDECYFSDMPVERIKPLIDILKGEYNE